MESDRARSGEDFPWSDHRNVVAKEYSQSVRSTMSHHRLLPRFKLCRRQIAASDAWGGGFLVHMRYNRSDFAYWLLQQPVRGGSWPKSLCIVNASKTTQTLCTLGQAKFRYRFVNDEVVDLLICELAAARDRIGGVGFIFGQRLLRVVLSSVHFV